MNNQKIHLDAEEQEILEAFESGSLVKVQLTKEEIKEHQEAAKRTLQKRKNMSLRVTAPDFLALKQYAAKEGIPYQTLAGSILHKFVNGELKPQ